MGVWCVCVCGCVHACVWVGVGVFMLVWEMVGVFMLVYVCGVCGCEGVWVGVFHACVCVCV